MASGRADEIESVPHCHLADGGSPVMAHPTAASSGSGLVLLPIVPVFGHTVDQNTEYGAWDCVDRGRRG